MAETVGGALLYAFLDAVFDRLASPEVVNFIHGKKLGLDLLENMKRTLRVVGAVLDDAEKKQITLSSVNQWLIELKDVLYEADDLLDEISTKAATKKKKVSKVLFSGFTDRKMASKLEKVVVKLDYVLGGMKGLPLREIAVENNEPLSSQPTTSLEDGYGMFGRDEEKEAIMKLLTDSSCDGENVSVIPIVGMGGVGKTTLARSVYNDANLKQIFDSKAWVCLSDKFDIEKVTKSMIEQVTQETCKLNDLNSLQLFLTDKLKQKKFLIVLDDVWIEDDNGWNNLRPLFLNGIRGSKILLTTRSLEVVSKVPFHTDKVYPLNQLSNEDCWLVFTNHAFPPSESNENRESLEDIGREIVKKCNGLPLAARSLGGMLRRKHAIGDWNNILKSHIWELPESQCKIIPALRISYHYLPPHLKRCFVYCSLYPKDYVFQKNELVLLWMAGDLLKPPVKGKMLEEVGYEYFDDLVSRSFFQCSNRSMDDFCMHDLATSLGGEFYFRSEGLGKETKIDAKTRHLSITNFREPISYIDVFDKVRFLRTFLPINFRYSPFEPCMVVSKLKYLRVLSFRGYRLNALPGSIGELIHLRYLNLSFTSIKTLPESLCNLYNLQTLKLSCCTRLTKLPDAMQNLVNLRHLHIDDTHIEEMPRGMGKLKNLQHLDFFIVDKHKKNIEELGGLSNLHGWLSIRNLENVTKTDEALEARIIDKKHIKSLNLEWSVCNHNDTDFQVELDVLCKLKPHQDLKSLSISGYKGTRFPDWVSKFSYCNMTYLRLSNCNNCCMLPSLGQLPSLKSLHISQLNSVKTIDAGFYKNKDCPSLTPFPSLEFLTIFCMACWEVWSFFDSEAFPQLKNLSIVDCPKLRGDLPSHLPALQELRIRNCKLLVSSVPRAPALKVLDIHRTKKVVLYELPLLLEWMDIEGTATVESMIKSMTNIKSSCLRGLSLWDCSSAISFPGGCLPASLEFLKIQDLEKLELPTLHKHKLLKSLTINTSCDSLISLPLDTFPNLITLTIIRCGNIKSLSISGSESLNSLSSVYIRDCPNFVSFPREGLHAPNLTHFYVYHCDKLNSLPDQMNTLVPKLEHLCINNCPKIELFPGRGMPPNLRLVSLVNCEKLLNGLAWPSMDMLTSLTIEGPCDGIKSFPEEGLLPPSLSFLHLHNFSNLETLDCKGLLHLISLQRLDIDNCQKLENVVGERLPLSLVKLCIARCPLLGKRCRTKHRQIWPKISHIRGIKVDYKCI